MGVSEAYSKPLTSKMKRYAKNVNGFGPLTFFAKKKKKKKKSILDIGQGSE